MVMITTGVGGTDWTGAASRGTLGTAVPLAVGWG
jgi:hypothetical protein